MGKPITRITHIVTLEELRRTEEYKAFMAEAKKRVKEARELEAKLNSLMSELEKPSWEAGLNKDILTAIELGQLYSRYCQSMPCDNPPYQDPIKARYERLMKVLEG